MNTSNDELQTTSNNENRSSERPRTNSQRIDTFRNSNEGFRPTPRAGARNTVDNFDSNDGPTRRRRTRIAEMPNRSGDYHQRSQSPRGSSGYGSNPRGRYQNEGSGYGNRYDNNERTPYRSQNEGRSYGENRSYDENRPYSDNRSSYGQSRQYGDYQQSEQRPSNYRQNQMAGVTSRFGDSSNYPHQPLSREERSAARPRQGGGGYGQAYGNRQRRAAGPNKPFDKNQKFQKKKRRPIIPVKYQEDLADPNEPIRLNKFLANAGVASRREADQLIENGLITVNGVVVTELGTRITRQDEVLYKNKRVEIQKKVYVLLNKPKNCVTTSDDPECRTTVMDIVRYACPERIYPVGRLDRNTTGVLLCTNDGDLAAKLTHPSFMKKKIYHVWLDKEVAMEDMQKIADGIELEDGEVHADALSYVSEEDRSQVGIEIHSGRNRIVRRIFEHLGYRVIKLDRVYFAGLTKKDLPRGRWRYLNEMEVINLRNGTFE